MINKRSLWFLTLFSLILVLSIYYITMPSELLFINNNDYTNLVDKEEVSVTPSSVLVALRVEDEEEVLEQINEYKNILTSKDASVEEKNRAFDNLKNINVIKGEEEKIEKQIKENYNLSSFVKIKDDHIKVVVDSSEHNIELANNIMRLVQSNYNKKMYITVKFESSKQ